MGSLGCGLGETQKGTNKGVMALSFSVSPGSKHAKETQKTHKHKKKDNEI